ncbi:MAG: hypothetical protein EBR32_00710 [Bacteroidetes bacterium]|nr:hypothetical protein [Bacteroidota bacterium]
MTNQIKQAQGILYRSAGQIKEAPEKARSILNNLKSSMHNKSLAEVEYLLGVSWIMENNYSNALVHLAKALDGFTSNDDKLKTGYLIGLCYFHLGELEKSESILNLLKDVARRHVRFWILFGDLSVRLGKPREALEYYVHANSLEPKNEEIAYKIAKVYVQEGNWSKALQLFDIALKMKPNYFLARVEKGELLRNLERFDEALREFQTNIDWVGDHTASLMGVALCKKDQGDYDSAIQIFQEILHKEPNHPSAQINLGGSLLEIGEYEEAENVYLKALKKNGYDSQLFSNYLMAMHYNPRHTKEEIFQAHLKWEPTYGLKPMPTPAKREEKKKIRLGFLSGGFRKHPVGWMITGALEHLDKNRFECYLYNANNKHDEITKRLYESSTEMTSVIGWSDESIAQRIRTDEIDILVELSGHAADNKLKVITKRPARIHVKWVGGLFNTSGLKSMDFLLTDAVQTPEGVDDWYTEKLIRLPDDYVSYVPPDYLPDISEAPLIRNGYLTLACFNNPVKINEVLLYQWSKILLSIPGSKLLLKGKSYQSQRQRLRLLNLFSNMGVSNDRIIIEGHSPHKNLLDRYNDVDIALDPWPYSGGLSTIEALIMGVPLISYPGPTFAGRHAASHLVHTGHPEWVANSWTDYRKKIIELSENPDDIARLRKQLRLDVLKSPICDLQRFSKNLGKVFEDMLMSTK